MRAICCVALGAASASWAWDVQAEHARRRPVSLCVKTTRRKLLIGAAAIAALPRLSTAAAEPQDEFYETVVKGKAASLAKKAPTSDADPLPSALKDLDYDHYRMINFRPDRAFWRDGGLFQVQLFHRGFQYDRKVTINLIENGNTTQLSYSPDLFDFRANTFNQDFPPTLGFSGFRLHFPINRPDHYDEVAVFQGASYYRLLARGLRFGASLRGLAINTADPHGEEFPYFTEFWLERPSRNAATMKVYGLLESKSATGAFRFLIAPRDRTTAQVKAEIYPRAKIKKLGIAPITSMYLHGKASPRRFADLRPEVHDSDGLLMRTGRDERIWRPLINPTALQISEFFDVAPNAFGLIQRERRFSAYEDLESGYENRPSIMIEPDGYWGNGAVELVEIPTDAEKNDNISAYWVPKQPVRVGWPLTFAYGVSIFASDRDDQPLARCVATFVGPVVAVDLAKDDGGSPRRFWLDFRTRASAVQPDDARLTAQVSASTGKVDDVHCESAGADAWRVAFRYSPDGTKAADIRAVLSTDGRPVSETWIYRWAPP